MFLYKLSTYLGKSISFYAISKIYFDLKSFLSFTMLYSFDYASALMAPTTEYMINPNIYNAYLS